jgi:steroid delta-isomerase-like uncharacterized protein
MGVRSIAGGCGAPGQEGDDVGQNASIARSTYEAWNERDFDRFAEVLANGVLIVPGTGDRYEGSDGARRFAEMWADGFPDGKIEIRSVVDGGDKVVIEFIGRGTQTGTLSTPMGDIPPTGKSIQLSLLDIWDFASDGTPKEVRTYFDTTSMMAQLGLAPQPAAAGIA